MSEDEEEGVDLPKLYRSAANAKRALTRAKKELHNALKALTEAPGSRHFFDELIKVQENYRGKRTTVLDIYDQIEDAVAPEKFEADFGRQTKEIERDFDVAEEQARLAISAHHTAVTDPPGSSAQAQPSRGGAISGAPKFKLEASFEPKPPLKIEMSPEEVQNWERQFQIYFNISHLSNADMDTQRAVLLNCLHTEFQMKVYEALSGVTDIKMGLMVIKEEIRKRNPRVVRRHHLFSVTQKKDEYKFSDTLSRLETLAREADLTDMSKDAILCHLILRACKDDNLRTKMLEVDEDEMSVVRLKEVVDRYEIIQTTNKSLGVQDEKEKVYRAKASENSICYRCQGRGHYADRCKIPAQSLFCQICSANSIPLPHSHNTFSGCKGKLKEEKTEEKKEDKKGEEKDKNETVKGKRAKVRGLSPAGLPESSDSEEEIVQAKRVQADDSSEEDLPAGDPLSSDDDEDDPLIDSGWTSNYDEVEEEDEGEGVYFVSSAEFVQIKVRTEVATLETSARPQSKEEKGSAASLLPRGKAVVAEPTEAVPVVGKKRISGQEQKMKCDRSAATCCNPKAICAIVVLVVVMLLASFIKWVNSDDETTNTMEPKVSGDHNEVSIRSDNKHEVSLLHIDNLASSQRTTNGLMIAGFMVIMLIAAIILYYHKRTKDQRRTEKTRERRQMMEKIQAIEDEMVSRGFMPKTRKKKKMKKMKMKNKRSKRYKKEKTVDMEAAKADESDSSEESG